MNTNTEKININSEKFMEWAKENDIDSNDMGYVADFEMLWECWKAAQKAGIVFALMTIGDIHNAEE